MEDDRVALSVQAGGHPAIGAMDDVAQERRALRLEVGDERVEILDLESDRAACGRARLVRDKIGERDTAAARQVLLDPPLVALVSGQAGGEPEDLFVELARARHVADRVHSERDLLEHERAPLSNTSYYTQPRWFQAICLSGFMSPKEDVATEANATQVN